MVKVYLLGQTAEDMKVIIMMIRNKEEVYLSGRMAENTMENGLMENNTVKESITHLNKRLKGENGKKERELDGSLMNDYFNNALNYVLAFSY